MKSFIFWALKTDAQLHKGSCPLEVDAVAERLTAALSVTGSILPRLKYLYCLEVVLLGLGVCVCDFTLPTIQEKLLVGMFFFFKNIPS